MGVGALLGHAADLAAHLDVPIRIVGVHDRQRDGRTLLHVALLHAPLCRVHANDAVGVVEPDRRHLRRAVGHHGCQLGKRRLLRQQVEIRVGDHCHLRALLVTRPCRAPPDKGRLSHSSDNTLRGKGNTMPSQLISFYSEGVRLAGDLFVPADLKAGEARAGIVLCHGYTGVRNLYLPDIARVLTKAGYVVLTFDYKGWGDSEGQRSRLSPYGRVIDSQSALTWLATQPMVDTQRLGLYGTSYGGATVVWVAAVDPRVKCVVSVVRSGNGRRWRRSVRRPDEDSDLLERL